MKANLSFRFCGRTALQAVVLTGLLGTALAMADTLDFSGGFAPANWQLLPEQGSVSFNSPANTELHLIGPALLQTPPTTSAESALYFGPGGAGVVQAGQLSFDWSFLSGAAINAQADFSWLSGVLPGNSVLSSGGPGQSASGNYSRDFDAGSQLAFLLTTDNPIGKDDPAELVISNFRFTPRAVPDPGSSVGLLALATAALGGWQWRSSRRSAE